MDKASASSRYQKPASGRRVRLTPATPRQEPPTPTTSSSSTTESTQSPETSPSDSQSGSPRGVMRRIRPKGEIPYPFTYQATNVRNEEISPSVPNSLESLDEASSLSDTQAMIFISSSSHDKLADTATGGKQEDNLVEIVVEIVVIDSEEDEEEMKGSSGQTSKFIENPEGPAIDTQDEAKAENEEVIVHAKWKRRIEETVVGLVA
ncbi:uncharacterized protein LOC121754433 [Salvia splendens]|uniref:uncharacterized protein LOC121754433 n=1 Tax=Salvia splendens TaxID=180675 RepID=UPI001C26F744|nr:uncharacterized protein LOC121754433 [Salvia splendens]